MSEDVSSDNSLKIDSENRVNTIESKLSTTNLKIASANSSESSSSNGEEYEIVPMIPSDEMKNEPCHSNSEGFESASSTSPSLNIVGNGNQMELQKTLKECVEDNEMQKELCDVNVPNTTDDVKENSSNISVVNETSVVEESEGENQTLFHDIKYLGAAVINDPKNERLIHSLMKELNVIDDLCEDDQDEETDPVTPPSSEATAGQKVTIRVPKSADGSVFVQCFNKNDSLTNEEGGIVGDFPIFRIIFFARGNAGTTEETCFAFTVAIPVTPSLKPASDSLKTSQGKVTFKCHAFRCRKSDGVTEVFSAFAQAFKKPKSEGKMKLLSVRTSNFWGCDIKLCYFKAKFNLFHFCRR